jgi:hypothetical protein
VTVIEVAMVDDARVGHDKTIGPDRTIVPVKTIDHDVMIDHDKTIAPTIVGPKAGDPIIDDPSNETGHEPNLDVTPSRVTAETPEIPETRGTKGTNAVGVRVMTPGGPTAVIARTIEASGKISETVVTIVHSREIEMIRHPRQIAATTDHEKKTVTPAMSTVKIVKRLRPNEPRFVADL